MKRFFMLAIVLFWLVMIGLLVRRSTSQSRLISSSPPPAGAITAQEEWMGIYQQDQKVGYLQRRVTPTNTGYQWEELWQMKLRVLKTPQTIHTEIRADTDQHYALTHFSFRLLTNGAVFQVTGEVAGQEMRGQI
ncbi:MAG TPA: hypothetical protein VKK81_16125, partial [Candidatus Binatia bacterium]|nr:hypothetical protein [Candidatus Binatia bacterium]